MDNSFEQCVRKHDYTQDEKKYKFFNGLMIAAAVCAFIGLVMLLLGDYILGVFMLAMWIAVGFGFFKMKENAIIEYDYEFVDGVITISRIFHQSKRKTVVSMSLEQVNGISPIDIEKIEKNAYNTKIINCALNDDAHFYGIKGTYKGQNVLVIWEPKLPLLKLIKSERVNLVVL